ncbi:hypothetical protein Ava_3563 [Trichormus variabilis ATCC 29413]|uniref:DUF4276 family protein n=2 Tax=Anabaena variabilis TaxID=264691 RepID=Q3M767_TRIV2|nr:MULTISPECIES: hypothetical protein [Nostocaceae]ABA23169.1 hypothetical protein Ava_3563 [Trichormus variabilis ATCC 29413]MBC1217141.1 hypothetical protein [Trichormus variabilis ARAD]MBC1255036.1 hypothetical protein [Trichormus variabilis V5]MBC1267825.1 hypothetical protein [Trichormus variabilis FSR]MBC1302958.1 hypothetical protein [Trichormus variabilis N2B]
MPSVRLWTPESDYDRDAVCCIAKKIVNFYSYDLTIEYATKQAYNDAARKPGGLKKAVDIYLKHNDLVIFLIDADGIQSQAQRLKERNSLFNKIQEVVNISNGKAKLILILQEIEAWLLVDCLGICCYFTKNPQNRNHQEWMSFAHRKQLGKTNLITEATPGGRNAKEHLEELSEDILIKNNPKLRNKPQNLKELKYQEDQAAKIAEFIEINNQTIKRNDSLEELAQHLKLLSENKLFDT